VATDATIRPASFDGPLPSGAGGVHAATDINANTANNTANNTATSAGAQRGRRGKNADRSDARLVRPAPPKRGPASWMRRLIGVREDVMDWEPEDRTKYTWFGAIVLNTAFQGGIAMAVAVSTVRSGLPTVAKILIAVVWFWIVLGLDSWLVSSTHGVSRARLLALLPRLALSVLLSLFVAEPLLLQVFNTEIQTQIRAVNEKNNEAFAGNLVRCNPTDGTVNTAPDCLPFQLHVAGSPVELQRQITANTADTATAQKNVDDYNATLGAKLKSEQTECARDHWVWRGSYWDTSTTCENIRKDIVTFQATNNITALNNQLQSAKQTGTTLTGQERTAGTDYQTALQAAIVTADNGHNGNLDTSGLLTRADALSVVSWSTWYAAFLTILLHCILLVVDAMPVLAKLMSGPTRYDRALARRQAANQDLHQLHLDVERVVAAAGYEYQKHERTQQADAAKKRVDHDLRVREAELAREFRAELDARAARILGSQI
jgi:hypothetical protein